MATPRTSFLMPVRNGEQTLEAAMASICAQTDPNFELLIINDHSTDRTDEIAMSSSDARIRVHKNPGHGLVDALNFGLQEARGTFIARMDADDLAAPERLELQLPYFDHPSLGVLDGQVTFFSPSGPVARGMMHYGHWVNSIIRPADFDRELLVESPVVHPAATYRRTVVNDLGGYRLGAFPEDYDLWLRIHAAGYHLEKVPSVLVQMRDHNQRLTRTDPRYSHAGFRTVRQQWLLKTQLVSPKRIVLFGAGKECGPWLRWLTSLHHIVVAIIDVSPTRIGRQRLGVPIIAIDDLPTLPVDIGLFLASTRGAREQGRAAIAATKPTWIEGRHWWAVR